MPGIFDDLIQDELAQQEMELAEAHLYNPVIQKQTVRQSIDELSSIRRRLLEQQSRRIDQELSRREGKLQVGRSRLSSSDLTSDDLRAIQSKLRDEVTFVGRQDDAARRRRTWYNNLTPLEKRASQKRMLHRSEKDTAEAIAGFLERERSQRRKLSRDDFDRVKAKAAARFRYGLAKKFVKDGKFKPGIDRRPARQKDIPRIAKELEKCRLRHQLREILAAKIGLRNLVPHLHGRSSGETRRQRREVMHFVRCL